MVCVLGFKVKVWRVAQGFECSVQRKQTTSSRNVSELRSCSDSAVAMCLACYAVAAEVYMIYI